MNEVPGPAIDADYFDGTSARARPVRLRVHAGALCIDGDDVSRRVPLAEVSWPERTAHGARMVHLRDGGSVVAEDTAAWDAWRRAGGTREPWVVRVQQSWRWTLACLLGCVAVVAAAYAWGVPWAARAVLVVVPASVDQAIGENVLKVVDERWMHPSALPADRQARLRDAWAKAVRALPAGEVPPHTLVFRKSRIGPNAFALPGGTIVVTDELVERVGADEAVLIGVLGHELGHLRHRHGMRMLVQVGALGAIAGVLVGDFSTLLAGVPVWLGQAAYSRDAEREADAEAVRVLRAAGLSPNVMVRFFEALARSPEHGERAVSFGLSTHPADAERIAFFRAAAAAR
jgi:Zn-dependent protease with chaperone function